MSERRITSRSDGAVFVCTGCGERVVQPPERAHLVPTAHGHKRPSGFGVEWHDYVREESADE